MRTILTTVLITVYGSAVPRLAVPIFAAASLLGVAGLSACAPTPASDDGRLSIVASTNVYGDIAARIAGDDVEVTSIITSAAQDPHSYEASAQDRLAIADADLVIRNGGGYDPFVDTLLDASGNDALVLLDAVEISALAGSNEHVWYSFEAMDALAGELAVQLGELDAENATTYRTNYESFAADLGTLEERAHDLRENVEGTGVAITEPVPLYLLAELGLDNATPDAFSEAIEEGTDVPPLVLDETLRLFTTGAVGLLAYNEQTAGVETDDVRAAAEAAGIPVVSFTETLPDGADYLSWMTDNLEAVASALT
jgi:zinc/manganese transport system substrate-binding protein